MMILCVEKNIQETMIMKDKIEILSLNKQW